MPANRALQLLIHSPIFAGAPAGDMAALAQVGGFRAYGRGDFLFREGDPIELLHIVSRGSVRVYRLAPSGTRELTLHVEGPRQLVAGIAAFQGRALPGEALYPADAQALEPQTETLALPVAVVREVVFGTPALAQAVIAYFARRQTELLGRVGQLVFTELGGRLAAYLLEHGAHELPTNSELAALLGTVPELVSRKLGEFYRLGLIRLERRRVSLLDRAELLRLAQH